MIRLQSKFWIPKCSAKIRMDAETPLVLTRSTFKNLEVSLKVLIIIKDNQK